MYRLLALDLDGTVLDHQLAIAPAVIDAITAAQAQGVRVTLATGRMYSAMLPFARQLGICDPVICYQGALIRHPISEIIYEHLKMPAKLAAEAINLLLQNDIFVVAYIDERVCIAERCPALDTYLRWHPEGSEIIVCPDLATLAESMPPTKLLFLADPQVVEREVAQLAAHFSRRLAVVRSHALFGELTAPGIDKGTALATLAAQLGISREHVLAIGDQENDLPMLTWAGRGLAMGNAPAAVQAAVAEVIPPVEQAGVAWAIRKYLIGL